MEIGELFRLNTKSVKIKTMIFRVDESINGRCSGCAGDDDKTFCHKLPDCYNAKSQPSLKFVKLNSNEAKRAIKQKITIKQY